MPVGGAPAFVPTDIAGLQLWLDAAQITGKSDGDLLASWLDVSGNSNNASQATAGLKPTYKTSIINSLPVVRCDGARVMDLASSIVLSDAYTLYVVGNRATSQTWTPIAHGPGRALLGILLDNNVYVYDDIPVGAALGYTGAAGNIIARWRRAAVGSTNKIRATSMSEGNVGIVGTMTMGAILAHTTFLYYTTGDIADILLWNVALTAPQLTQVDDYLAAKWGISV
jgi:hypothetical protein